MGGRVRSPDPEGSPRRRLRRRRQGGGGRGRYHRFQPHDQHQLAHALILQRRVLVALAGTGLFIAALDAYVVVTLLPAMMSDIGLTIERLEQATPIVTGFLAGYVVAMPLLGAYSDVRGRIPVYVACIAAFAVGSVMTATAGIWGFAGLPWLVVGRFVQGLGGGGLVLGVGLGLLVIALYPDDPEHRPTDALFVPAIIAAALALAAYGWRHVRELEPLIPRDLLRSRTFIGAAVANVLVGAALIVALVDVPLLGRLVFNLDQLQSGLLLTQFLIGVPVG